MPRNSQGLLRLLGVSATAMLAALGAAACGSPSDGRESLGRSGAAVEGGADAGTGPARTRRLAFLLDQRFLEHQSLAEIAANLAGYVADAESVFRKNTPVRFTFDPATDLEFFETSVGTALCLNATSDFYHRAEISWTERLYSGGGSSGCAVRSGDELLSTSYQWRRIYSREEIAAGLTHDDYYLRQVSALVHEIGHQYGLGLAEYYSLARVTDTTGRPPDLSISSLDPDDAYWSQRARALADPMFGTGSATGAEILAAMTFSPLGARIIDFMANEYPNASCPGSLATLCTRVTDEHKVVSVRVTDPTGLPVPGCTVRSFQQSAAPPYPSAQLQELTTDSEGRAIFDLAQGRIDHSNFSMLALFKAECQGAPAAGKALSIFDLQAGQYMPGGGEPGDFRYGGSLELSIVLPIGAGPSVPTGLAASNITGNAFTLTWSPSTGSVDITGYKISRQGSPDATATGTSYAFTGLSCATSYSVSVAALDAAGRLSDSSAPLSVTTSDCAGADTLPPSVPTGLAASSITDSYFVVSWSPSTDNVGVTGYKVFLDQQYLATITTPALAFAGRACGTTYRIEVAALDAAGWQSANSTSLNVTTLACAGDTTAPSVPTGVSTSGVTATSLYVSWAASADNVGVAGYKVFKNGEQIGTTTSLYSQVSGLPCGTTYAFSVSAYDAAGNNSAQSTYWYATTSACPDTQPPTVPIGLAASSVSQTGFTLTWQPSTDNVGVTGYKVFRNSDLVATVATPSYSFTGLSCGATLSLEVAARDAAGWQSANSTPLSVTTLACVDPKPSMPTSFRATGISRTSVSLAWVASTDDVAVTGYKVLVNSVVWQTGPATLFSASGLVCGTSYHFGVFAYDADGWQSPQANLEVTTAACPETVPPTSPTNLAASGVTPTSATISWTASSDNVGISSYQVYVNSSLVTSNGFYNLTFTLVDLACSARSTVGITATDPSGNVSPMATLSITTAACVTPKVGTTNVGTDSVLVTAGRATASKFSASVAGTVTQLCTFVDFNATPGPIAIGLYTNTGTGTGRPKARKTWGTISSPTLGAINCTTVTGFAVTSRTKYWIAVLNPSGGSNSSIRINAPGLATLQTSAATYAALPASWPSSGNTSLGASVLTVLAQ